MLFNSWTYILFFIFGATLHWVIPHRFRTVFLALASLLFYAMWRWEFSFLIIFTASLDFSIARRIHIATTDRGRFRWLLLSLVVQLGFLCFFKYTYFVLDNIRFVGNLGGMAVPSVQDLGVHIIIPLGISFYTFHSISYVIDVYRRVIEPCNSFAAFFAYVTFWPQLIAGPILRAREVIPQLQGPRTFSFDEFNEGLMRILLGLFKKVVLADNIAGLADEAFTIPPATMTAFDVWVAAFLFGFQIYFDFSGYSDIAIGSARSMGLRFPENFLWPYIATSPREFWHRWHISLSSWIRDYLYLPLTGQKFRTTSTDGLLVATESGGEHRTRGLFLAWLIMGLWHGSAWTFVGWGLYHACLVFAYRVFTPLTTIERRVPVIAWALMLFFSMAGWIIFRSESVGQALGMFEAIVNPFRYTLGNRAVSGFAYHIAASMLCATTVAYWLSRCRDSLFLYKPIVCAATCVGIATVWFLLLTCMRTAKRFIYFQF